MIKYLSIIYRNTISSIAFLPTIISLLFFLIALGMLHLDSSFSSGFFFSTAEPLIMKGSENSRSLLTALIGGIISLMVFSFSIVMVLINQASSSFTPRIIPELLRDRKHQFVLGFYLGSIIYFIIQILNIKEGDQEVHPVKPGILLAMFFGIGCLGLFIYFIHLLSQKFQVDCISIRAARQSEKRIEEVGVVPQGEIQRPNTQGWYTLNSFQSGYISEIDVKKLQKICKKHHIQLELLHRVGTFCLKDVPVCRVNNNIAPNKWLQDVILSSFNFSYQPFSKKTFLYGINQITEIAVKALSPGINDPGTALIALDHLSSVFTCLLKKGNQHVLQEAKWPFLLLRQTYSLNDLFFAFITPIGHYGKGDAKIHSKLLDFYARLLPYADQEEQEIIWAQLREEMESFERNIESTFQLDTLRKQFNSLRC